MLLGQQPGTAYTDGVRHYYDALDGRVFRTGVDGHGLYEWRRNEWRQVTGEAQWRPMHLAVFQARLREQCGDSPASAPSP